MVRRKKTKTTALVLTAVCILLSVVQSATRFPLADVAIGKDCTILARFTYSFFHASIPHALINCWCLLSLVFIYDVSISYLMLAYLIAVTYPAGFFAAAVPAVSPAGYTVGLSAVCFALMGMVSFQTRRKLLFHTWVASLIAAGFAIPYLCSVCGYTIATPNNILHIYCYVAGLMGGFLNSPVPWQR